MSTDTGWASRLDALAFWGLIAALLWAPWPLGSNRPWAVAVLALAIWVCVLCATLARALAGSPVQGQPRPPAAAVPLAALAGFALLLVAQLVPGLGADGAPISIAPFHTRGYLLRTAVYGGAWLLVMLTVRDAERGARLLGAIVAAGVLQAVAVVLLSSSTTRYDWFFEAFEPRDRASGTFRNPDHMAGFMELGLSAGLGWLLSQLGGGQRQGRTWQAGVVRFLSFVMSAKMLLRLLLVVMVVALVLSHSRMGNGAFFLAIGLTGALVAVMSQQLRRPALWLVASMALVDLLIIGQWVGLDRVVQRMQNTVEASSDTVAGFGLPQAPPPQEESLQQRLEVPLLSLRLVADRPWFGHGGGTYATAFTPFKQPGLPLHWDHAHNDYVQVACDTGLVGLALWLTVGLASLWRAVRLLNDAQPGISRGFAIAAVMAICTMGLHSMVDFNLHIPANALTFTALLAAVWTVQVVPPRRRRSAPVSTAKPEPEPAA